MLRFRCRVVPLARSTVLCSAPGHRLQRHGVRFESTSRPARDAGRAYRLGKNTPASDLDLQEVRRLLKETIAAEDSESSPLAFGDTSQASPEDELRSRPQDPALDVQPETGRNPRTVQRNLLARARRRREQAELRSLRALLAGKKARSQRPAPDTLHEKGQQQSRPLQPDSKHNEEDWKAREASDASPDSLSRLAASSDPATAPSKRTGIWTTLKERLQAPDRPMVSGDEWNSAADTTSYSLHDTPLAPRKAEAKKSEQDNPLASAVAKKPRRQTRDETKEHTNVINPSHLRLSPVGDDSSLNVPKLAHNLDRVLFNRGVYEMQDKRSQVYNFDPHLATIMPNDEFNFDALKRYVTSSEDSKLRELSAIHGSKYCGSTSSMTSILAHFHFLISGWRPLNYESLSQSFKPDSMNYTQLSRSPAASFLNLRDGIYAIDSDKEFDSENVLSLLGQSMEKLLTLPKEEFDKYRRSRSHQLSEEEKNVGEAYHYTTLGDFMMRSQLDAQDPRLPGTGVFDLKTRAVVTIRMDVTGYEKGTGYEIRKRLGQWESFEREYYDMIRSAFLKYSLQVRMGRMDGIFVAYHNTQRIFGFQYIPLEEMDRAIHDSGSRALGDKEFKVSLAMLNDLLDRATKRFPGRSLRLHVETRPTHVPLTYFFAKPVTKEEIQETQAASKSSAERLERKLRRKYGNTNDNEDVQADKLEGDDSLDEEPFHEHRTDDSWIALVAKVVETTEDENLGLAVVRETVRDAFEELGLLRDKSDAESQRQVENFIDELFASDYEVRATPEDALLANESQRSFLSDEFEEVVVSDESEEQSKKPAAMSEHDHPTDDADGSNNHQSRPEETSSSEDKDVGPGLAKDGDATPSLSSLETAAEQPSLKSLVVKSIEAIDAGSDAPGAFERLFSGLPDKSTQPNTNIGPEESSQGPLRPTEPGSDEVASDIRASAESDGTAPENTETAEDELLGMYVTVRNQVNGQFVERAPSGTKDSWKVFYSVVELPDERARKIYKQLKNRRRDVYGQKSNKRSSQWYKMFGGALPRLSSRGERIRSLVERNAEGKSVRVAWDRQPLEEKTVE